MQVKYKSLHIILDIHMSCEEHELWSLSNTHFSVKECDMIISYILRITGVEVLHKIFPCMIITLT